MLSLGYLRGGLITSLVPGSAVCFLSLGTGGATEVRVVMGWWRSLAKPTSGGLGGFSLGQHEQEKALKALNKKAAAIKGSLTGKRNSRGNYSGDEEGENDRTELSIRY